MSALIPFLFIFASAIDEIFTAFFFGSGAWLGFLVFTTLIIGLVFLWKPLVVISLFVSMLLGLEYLTNGLGWHGIGMFLIGILVLFLAASKWKGGE